jgi:hypothetical protein
MAPVALKDQHEPLWIGKKDEGKKKKELVSFYLSF